MDALNQLRNLARYKTHGGYRWAAIMRDGALVCERCASTPENYRLMYRATKSRDGSDWQCVGITHSGESDETEVCANCNRTIWAFD